MNDTVFATETVAMCRQIQAEVEPRISTAHGAELDSLLSILTDATRIANYYERQLGRYAA